jgi:hypothetical protein
LSPDEETEVKKAAKKKGKKKKEPGISYVCCKIICNIAFILSSLITIIVCGLKRKFQIV